MGKLSLIFNDNENNREIERWIKWPKTKKLN
jgi:hypothetical protein